MARVKKIGRKDKVTWKEAADNFLLLKRAQGIAPRTLEEYEYHVARFEKKTMALEDWSLSISRTAHRRHRPPSTSGVGA